MVILESLLFLIPLGIGLISAYLSQKAVDDLAEIIDFASTVNLILSVILAPWQLHLLLIMLLIFNTKMIQSWLQIASSRF